MSIKPPRRTLVNALGTVSSGSLLDRFKVTGVGTRTADIQRWLQSDFGRYLLRHEHQVLRDKFPELPGYRMLRLGLSDDVEALDCFKQIHRFSMHPCEHNGNHAAIADYAELPLMSETVDVMLLHHAIEFSTSPKAVLAEANRVVVPGGHLILCLFNPYGPMGILKYPMQLFFNRAQYGFHNLRLGRVSDWLSLLNFHVVQIEHGAYNVPINSSASAEHDSRWERACQKIRFPLGNFYMIRAVKRVPRGIRGTAPAWQAATNGYGAANGLKRKVHTNSQHVKTIKNRRG
jgi:SAM-dependent methyltransferase